MVSSNMVIMFMCTSILSFATADSRGGTPISIIPKPVKMEVRTGVFRISPTTCVVYDQADSATETEVGVVLGGLRAVIGFDLPVVKNPEKADCIQLSVDPELSGVQKEGYTLQVTPSGVKIAGIDHAGLFHGLQTLLQLLPPEVASRTPVHNIQWAIPCVSIEDYPRFGWRGMHLDVGRHFFPVSFIKKYLDLMAMYKLNMFHWHLTEDQGWRIEIKRYPRLTQVGAWRKETMGDGIPYGGYYTQDDIRDIVAYANARCIQIVPEIEMPGHSRAALAAYPEFSCRQQPLDVGTKWGIEQNVFCAGNDSTFMFIENILTEVFGLFPGKYIHIGGDECPKDRWKECPKCQARIKAEGLHNEEELQSYFVKRIEQFINSRGKRMIGWDEILEGGLAPNATVMSWRGTQGGIDAAVSGHDVVMTPTSNCYFDYSQSLTGELDSTRAFLPLDSVYNYEPVPASMTAEEARHVLGSQGNVWTEWMPDSKRVEYMVLPRMCALSEMVWTPKTLRNYSDFQDRLVAQYDRFDCLGVRYRVPTPFTLGGVTWSFGDTLIAFPDVPNGARAYYTLDGTEPTQESTPYRGPVRLTKSGLLKAKLFLSGGRASNTVWMDFSKLNPDKNGMRYEYRVPARSDNADSSQWAPVGTGQTYDFSLPGPEPDSLPFSVKCSGFMKVEQTGLYTFYVQADSGSELWVDNQELVAQCPPDRHWWREGRIYLEAGKYPISVLDIERDRWRGVVVEYEGPGVVRQPIPPRLLTQK